MLNVRIDLLGYGYLYTCDSEDGGNWFLQNIDAALITQNYVTFQKIMILILCVTI